VTKEEKKRIKDLERELARKDRALAETAALLVLRKKASAIRVGATRTRDQYPTSPNRHYPDR
jgi:putative transposase